MSISEQSMIAILLCSHLGLGQNKDLKPFTLTEWNDVSDVLKKNNEAASLLFQKENTVLEQGVFTKQKIDRIHSLLDRSGAAALEIEFWLQRGIQIITIFDDNYPKLLKKRLQKKAPPVLFYAGDINLSNKIGISIVGSRNIDEAGMEFTKKLVSKAAKENLVIYSGGARGVDSISEKAALEEGSAVISFIADSLASKIKKRDVIDAILGKRLLLLSDVKPDVGFSAARAMNRNKYVYAASYGTFVVAADYKSGGTWSGAIENIKYNWTKEFVWEQERYSGNKALISIGANAFNLSDEKIYDLIMKKEESYKQLDFTAVFNSEESIAVRQDIKDESAAKNIEQGANSNDLYEVVREQILINLGNGLSLEEAAEKFHIAKGQMKTWLKRLCDEKAAHRSQNKYIKNT